MNRLGAAFTFGSIAIAMAIGCSTSVSDPDSETHWLHECTVDSDCEQGLSCLCNTCTRACGGRDCGGLGTSAACVTPTQPSFSDACQLAPGIALCTSACSNDTACSAAGAGLRCVGGACLAGSPRASAGRATSTATWVADLVDAYCTWGVRCGKFSDGATCDASKGIYFITEGFDSATAAITAVSKGTAEFDDAAATACLTELSQAGCDTDFWTQPSLPAPCMAAFSGHVSGGGTCIDDVECASGSLCIVASTVTCTGTCTAFGGGCRMDVDCPGDQYCGGVPWQGPGFLRSGSCAPLVPPGANPGDPCGTPVQCETGLYCPGGPAPALCAARVGVGVGETCGGRVGPGCALGLACVTSDDGTTQTCMPEAKLGDPCTSLFQCGAQYRLSDMICDVTGTHTCVHRPSTGSCVLVSGVNSCDPVTSYCDGTAGAGTCKPWLSLGAPCVFPTNGFDPCGRQASCQGSRCVSTVAPVCTPT